MPYYARGDYYRGDYYVGDPGLFSGILKGIAGAATGFLTGGPLGAIQGGASAVLGAAKKGQGAVNPTPGPPNLPMIAPRTGFGLGYFGPTGGGVGIGAFPEFPQETGGVPVPTMVGPDGRVCTVPRTRLNRSTYVTRGGGTSRWPQTLIVHPKGTECVKSRRMNVANPRALRRALRRASGFAKLARRYIKITHHYKARVVRRRRKK
jgi:hypothetical protein